MRGEGIARDGGRNGCVWRSIQQPAIGFHEVRILGRVDIEDDNLAAAEDDVCTFVDFREFIADVSGGSSKGRNPVTDCG